jgi:hypothetical protein
VHEHEAYHSLHPMHCTIIPSLVYGSFSSIGHVYAELELKVSTKQVQVEDFTKLVLTQGKPRCIPPKSLSFIFKLYL